MTPLVFISHSTQVFYETWEIMRSISFKSSGHTDPLPNLLNLRQWKTSRSHKSCFTNSFLLHLIKIVFGHVQVHSKWIFEELYNHGRNIETWIHYDTQKWRSRQNSGFLLLNVDSHGIIFNYLEMGKTITIQNYASLLNQFHGELIKKQHLAKIK